MAKFGKQSLCPKPFFVHMLIISVLYKYQRASVKALVQVDFLVYTQSKHKHIPYLIEKNG